jgi:hypothetical protein
MKKTTFWVAALGCVALLVSGGLFASNMGFKLNYPLTGPGAFPEDGTNTISLPYNQQTGLATAADLIADIGGADCANSADPVLSVSRYNKGAAGLVTYTGCAGVAFALVSGEGYQVKVDTDTNYIVVGSHKPGFAVTLTGPAAFPEDGTNIFSYPYHSTSGAAADLIADIGGADCANAADPVLSVARYNKGAAGLIAYTGCAGISFPLTAGEAYYVKVDTDVPYVPSHF